MFTYCNKVQLDDYMSSQKREILSVDAQKIVNPRLGLLIILVYAQHTNMVKKDKILTTFDSNNAEQYVLKVVQPLWVVNILSLFFLLYVVNFCLYRFIL